MKVLVLGGNGFIGSNFVSKLSTNSLIDKLTVLSKSVATSKISGVFYRQGDYKHGPTLSEALQGQNWVYHLISETLPFTSWDDPVADVQNNLIPFIEFIEACAEHRVSRVIFISSGGTVYGKADGMLRELDPAKPFVPYGIVKLAMENFLNYAQERYGIDYLILRVSNIFGPGQDISKGLGFVNTALNYAVLRLPITLYGDGENQRDYLYIDDLVRFLQPDVLNLLQKNDIYNLCTGTLLTQNQILEKIEILTKGSILKHFLTSRSSDIRSIQLDNTKLKELLPDFWFTPFDEALKYTLKSILEVSNISR